MIDTLERAVRDSDPVAELLAEVGKRNLVTVTKYERIRPKRGLPTITRKIDVPSIDVQASFQSLHALDCLRALKGDKPKFMAEALDLLGVKSKLMGAGYNLRTNVGVDFVYNQLSGTSVLVADTLALSNNTVAVAAADTSNVLPWNTAQATNAAASGTTGEWTGLGLTRKVATTNTHTGSASTYVLAATWTASGTSTGTSKIGLFGGAAKATQTNGATNILVLVNTFTATDLVTSDQLTVTWTITI